MLSVCQVNLYAKTKVLRHVAEGHASEVPSWIPPGARHITTSNHFFQVFEASDFDKQIKNCSENSLISHFQTSSIALL